MPMQYFIFNSQKIALWNASSTCWQHLKAATFSPQRSEQVQLLSAAMEIEAAALMRHPNGLHFRIKTKALHRPSSHVTSHLPHIEKILTWA